MVKSWMSELARIDRELSRLTGLTSLPGWARRVDTLLAERLKWMTVRDRGFTVTDRRRASSR